MNVQTEMGVCIHAYVSMHTQTEVSAAAEGCSLYELPLDAATQPCKIGNSDLRITETCFGISMTVEFLQEH